MYSFCELHRPTLFSKEMHAKPQNIMVTLVVYIKFGNLEKRGQAKSPPCWSQASCVHHPQLLLWQCPCLTISIALNRNTNLTKTPGISVFGLTSPGFYGMSVNTIPPLSDTFRRPTRKKYSPQKLQYQQEFLEFLDSSLHLWPCNNSKFFNFHICRKTQFKKPMCIWSYLHAPKPKKLQNDQLAIGAY